MGPDWVVAEVGSGPGLEDGDPCFKAVKKQGQPQKKAYKMSHDYTGTIVSQQLNNFSAKIFLHGGEHPSIYSLKRFHLE